MTSEQRPLGSTWRTTPELIRRASLADASTDFDDEPFTEWLRLSGVYSPRTVARWRAGAVAELPIGEGWDVVILPLSEGWSSLRHLRTVGASVGPVLHSSRGVEFLVPVGSATRWDLRGAVVRSRPEVLLAPVPSVVAPRTHEALTWLAPPRSAPTLTDADDLYGAYAAALALLGSARKGW
ncbi:hypothetical protein [Streptomyces sp. NPDC008125]|uniref:hypothetical protein n=1 Tax=Streptomyces sp. NPDC008125 TaxID=3364811 RepID=UPI0036E59882